MTRDLFEEYGIAPKKKKKPVDIFEQEGINQPQESKGISGIASDALNKSIETLMGIPSAMLNLPQEAYGAGKQVLTEPKRALQNVGAGFGELGHGILSAPGNVRDYLAKKDVISQNTPSMRLPESVLPKDFDYAQGMGVKGQQPGDSLLRSLPASVAMAPAGELMTSATESMAPILAKAPGITNKSIANSLSRDKSAAIQKAMADYGNLFSDVKNAGINKIPPPKMDVYDIVKHSQPRHHEALKEYLKNPTFENAHWAQSDLGFIVRHLKKIDEQGGLSSTQHKTLKNSITAQNRLKKAMFKDDFVEEHPELESRYNQLSGEYAENVVPYKQLDDLNQYEHKKMTANNLVKSLFKDDEFMLGLGRKYYPRLLANKILRSNISKILGGSAISGLGFEEGRKLIK